MQWFRITYHALAKYKVIARYCYIRRLSDLKAALQAATGRVVQCTQVRRHPLIDNSKYESAKSVRLNRNFD